MDHSVEIELEELLFQSMEEFNKWKDDMQTRSVSYYSLDTSTKHLSCGDFKQYYNCHRSYTYKPKGKNIRSLKATGTNKIGSACPSRLEVTIKGTMEKSELVQVKFWKTHYGHSLDLGHTCLGKDTRKELAGKLQQGVTFQHILDQVRESDIKEEGLKRNHLLEKKDLHNIMRDFNLSHTFQKHNNDAISVHLWVEEMMGLGSLSPVLKYKRQNETDNRGIFDDNDFFLVLMTEFQSQQLLKFGKDKICIDGTHGTNAYDIQLFSLLVVDEYGGGCPVAFCLSNRCHEAVFKVFFESIKEKVGKIEAHVFMSDDAPAFYNAWSIVMGAANFQLICSWHVDRNWRQNLSKICDTEKRSLVYKTLKVLLRIDDSNTFNTALTKFMGDLMADHDTLKFAKYFQAHYCNRIELWAYCYRQHLGINTNMYLESLHKTLKYYYLEGKKVKRLDRTIHAIMKFARDCLFKRILKITKNAATMRIKNIQVAHTNSQAICSEMVKSLKINEWLVQSSKCAEQEYIVQKVQENCLIKDCPIKCCKCKICVHIYKCSCMDSVIKFNICKHIHAVTSYSQLSDFSTLPSVSQKGIGYDQTPNFEKVQELGNLAVTSNMSNLENKNILKRKLDIIRCLSETTTLPSNEETLAAQYLDKIIDIFNKNEIKFAQKQPVNTAQRIEKQVRLFSTKKKRQSRNDLSKPSLSEAINIKDSLAGKADSIVFHSKNDHTYS
ncbi:unnamed protein product [Callosobruchus maculatus]|uniref:MULE transposase domain-containing protein n=1 Tax=Callosobruchus maculatus TaxID=64391 RepID=A0A653CEK2_CALMS|nr:unnamed protein product [Callosobruchus maculatus]